MINHKYKCIYIHIARTGGSSIERSLCKTDWWYENPHTKHIRASVAKKIYKPYWNDYFKFSIVRNPWARMISQYHAKIFNGATYGPDDTFFAQHPEYFESIQNNICIAPTIGVKSNKGLKHFLLSYKPPIWEHESVTEYTDMLDEELDFIGKYERLEKDFEFVKQNIGFKDKLVGSATGMNYKQFYDIETFGIVKDMHIKSISKFDYSFI